jgi:LmbE family N-acetylglucosaminyl deacetylase
MSDAGFRVWSLAEAEAVALAQEEELRRFGETLVVAPHPDDESFGCGGVIARLRRAGIGVRVAVLTDGSRSHPGSRAYPPSRLVALRKQELVAAVRELGVGVDHLHFLELEDANVPPPEAPLGRAAIAALRALIADVQTVLVTFRRDPHEDHRAAFDYVARARAGLGARLLEYPIWLWESGAPGDWPARGAFSVLRVGIDEVLPQKRAAIAAHCSQVTDLVADDPESRLSPLFLGQFDKPWELFFQER